FSLADIRWLAPSPSRDVESGRYRNDQLAWELAVPAQGRLPPWVAGLLGDGEHHDATGAENRWLLLALSGHGVCFPECPLLGVKRTCEEGGSMSASDPKRTYSVPFDHLVGAGAGSSGPPRRRHDMLTQPQEANLVTYNVGLCRMVNGNLDAPYEGASIE